MRSLILVPLTIATSIACAGDATLQTSSKAAYEASLAAMIEGRTPEDGRALILRLLILAAKREGLTPPAAMKVFGENYERYLSALRQYDGWTFAQIISEDR